MKKTEDYSSRAAEFLKTWQEAMARQIRDPDVIRSLLAAMQSFAGGTPNDETARKRRPANDADDDAIGRLTRRVDALEHELARLVAQLEPHVSVAAKAKNPARTGNGRGKPAMEKRKRPMGPSKRRVAKATPGPAKKRKPAARKPK